MRRVDALKHLSLAVGVLLLLSACMPAPRSGGGASKNAALASSSPTAPGSGMASTVPSGTGIDSGTSLETWPLGKAEIRQIVNPFTGSYQKKISIPKNYKGKLYLSGLNLTSLNAQFVYVRFTFGREKTAITLPATIARASGIIPAVDMNVLVVHVDRDFQQMTLPYDLFDYSSDSANTPVQDPRDPALYCRGLNLEDDPTFESSSTNTLCDAATETCKYAYAKIKDAGLVNNSVPANPIYITPTLAQLSHATTDYNSDTAATQLKKCLPDNNIANDLKALLNVTDNSINISHMGGSTSFTYNGISYLYKGPFRAINTASWQISGAAWTTSSGLYGDTTNGLYYESYLFPRATQMQLRSQVQYLGNATDPVGEAISPMLSMSTSGTSAWMNGCNARVTNYDAATNEGIGSCNVTGTIDLVTLDFMGNPTVLASTKDIKVQLLRPSLTDYLGNELLFTAAKTCTTSNSCGSNECCYNSHCWSKDLVSACKETMTSQGNKQTGETCASDYDCSSLCCNQSLGVCSVHEVNGSTDATLCAKPPGESCVAAEWCRKENVVTCDIYRTGTGVKDCALRCYNIPTFGLCRNGECSAPTTPSIPVFDSANPDCTNAKEPPTYD